MFGPPPDKSPAEGVLRIGSGIGDAGLLPVLTVPFTLGAGPLSRVRPLLIVIGVTTMFECWFTIVPSLVPVEGLVKKNILTTTRVFGKGEYLSIGKPSGFESGT